MSQKQQSAEYSGRSVEDAVAKAARALGVPGDQLGYRVVEDTTRSILGLVISGVVTIKVTVPDGVAVKPPEPKVVPAAPVVKQEAPLPEREPVKAKAKAPAKPAVAKPAAAPARRTRRPRSDSADRNPPELEEVASEVVATLLDKMGMLGAVEVVDRGGEESEDRQEISPLVLNVVGEDLGGLIGRRGETLRDLQFMVRLIVSHRIGAWPNVVIDVEGYKGRREETLRSLAVRMAEQAIRTNRRVVLEPMPAHERRILHLALRDKPEVRTESTGEGEHRKVQIIPS